MKRNSQILGLLLIFFAVCSGESYSRSAEKTVNTHKMTMQIIMLASGEFQGRKPFTTGEELTVHYLKNVIVSLGLEYGPETWNLEAIADDAHLAFRIGWKLANSRDFPEWKDSSEFKTIRQEQMKNK